MPIDLVSLKAWIRSGEGYNRMPYLDSVGKLTIGFGRNLHDNGISIDEAELMLSNDINLAIKELQELEWYNIQPDSVKTALINMNFNLGISRLLEFHKMIAALSNKDYATAAREALTSLWSHQIGERAKDIAIMIRQGNAESGRHM